MAFIQRPFPAMPERPTVDTVKLIEIGPSELGPLWRMVQAMNAEDGHPVSERSRAALEVLLKTPAYGKAFWVVAGITGGAPRVGYAIVCFGYSVELGGRDLLIDEIYIVPEHRGSGIGTAALRAIEAEARAMGFASVFLEVMAGNQAEGLYRRLGYADRESVFLGKTLLDTP